MCERSPWRCAHPWRCERLQHQAVDVSACAPLPLLFVPIINPFLPDESIRFPRPAAQGSTYEIDSIEKADFFFPPLIYNSPISPLRNFNALRRHLTVTWKYVRHTFDMNLTLFALKKKYVEA